MKNKCLLVLAHVLVAMGIHKHCSKTATNMWYTYTCQAITLQFQYILIIFIAQRSATN